MNVNVHLGLKAYAYAIATKDGVEIARYRTHNVITDMGLGDAKTVNLDNQLDYVNFVRKTVPPIPLASADQLTYVKNVTLVSCGAGNKGAYDRIQDSWLEGWTDNRPTADVHAVDDNYTYWDYTRQWTVTTVNAFDLLTRQSELKGNAVASNGSNEAGEFNGADPLHLTHFFFSRFAGFDIQSLPVQCLDVSNPADPVEDNFNTHASNRFWAHGYFTDEYGNPIEVEIPVGVNLEFYYHLRLMLPSTPVVDIINVNGTPHTFTTRAHAVHQQTTWNILELGTLDDELLNKAWESATMPALNDVKVASGLGSAACSSAIVTPGGSGDNSQTVEYKWSPGIANFTLGISAITHGVRANALVPFMITTIDPPIMKDNQERIVFTVKYLWDRF